jgi:N-succinyldiaminopimelate aminotransferase
VNPRLSQLHAYPFERLQRLLSSVTPPADREVIPLSIGEPRHAAPAFVIERLREAVADLTRYPATAGLPALRACIAAWLARRFSLPPELVDPERCVLPVSGTREALFSFVQSVVDPADGEARVLMPNPFYQIYEGGALLAGASPWYMNLLPANGHLPDLDAVPAEVWHQCRLLFLCTPGNPTGAVHDLDFLCRAVTLAQTHGFVIASDECYSELYRDEDAPPPGLLQACHHLGLTHFDNCVVFHSLSKRSNLPGLRSGFVAGDPRILAAYRTYRTYHGCAVPIPTQLASIAAWSDEAHVVENRRLYREKFDIAAALLEGVLEVEIPPAGFYLWARTPVDDEPFVREGYAREGIVMLPGRYLARPGPDGRNPGEGRVRISLVPDVAQCRTALERLRRLAGALGG